MTHIVQKKIETLIIATVHFSTYVQIIVTIVEELITIDFNSKIVIII